MFHQFAIDVSLWSATLHTPSVPSVNCIHIGKTSIIVSLRHLGNVGNLTNSQQFLDEAALYLLPISNKSFVLFERIIAKKLILLVWKLDSVPTYHLQLREMANTVHLESLRFSNEDKGEVFNVMFFYFSCVSLFHNLKKSYCIFNLF